MITKLIFNKKKFGCSHLSDKSLKIEHNTPKDLQDKINLFFQQKKKTDGDEFMEEESTVDQSVKVSPMINRA